MPNTGSVGGQEGSSSLAPENKNSCYNKAYLCADNNMVMTQGAAVVENVQRKVLTRL